MVKSAGPVRVRMAPSPTGFLHIGTARTALFNWLFARKYGGVFILRIEDTDTERSRPEFERHLLENLHWLGLDWGEGPDLSGDRGDFGPYRQSERSAIYRRYLEKLLDEKKAYYCYCTKEELEGSRQSLLAAGLPPKYSGKCRELTEPPPGREPQVIRLKVPGIKIKFQDLVRGPVEFDAELFGDLIIARDLGSVLYNFAVVVDDFEMKISHVIRGEDHLSNTPKQILFAQALGFALPVYAHLPLILSSSGKGKMSKRESETNLETYRAQGYLPEAIINFLALLGWHPAGDKEFLSRTELLAEFDLRRVQKASAFFNSQKLDFLNSLYIRRLDLADLVERTRPFAKRPVGEAQLTKMLELLRDRLVRLADFETESFFLFELPAYEPALLIWKKSDAAGARAALRKAATSWSALPAESFAHRDALAAATEPLVDPADKGAFYWPLRVALTGLAASPEPLATACVLGQAESLSRIAQALAKLQTMPDA